jgi:hypothetical protein
LYTAGAVTHRQARVGHHWRDNEQGNDYIATLDLGATVQPEAITVRTLLPVGQFLLRGLTLIDENTGTNRILSIHPAYRQVHSGDVKVYENLTVMPRAFVVHQARVVADDDETRAILHDPAFNPTREVILSDGEEVDSQITQSDVEIVTYEPEEIRLRATLEAPGYLVLTDTYYPGWVAEVDGRYTPIQRANLYFRAVPLEAGNHEITFRFQPTVIRWGLIISIVSWFVWGLAITVVISYIGRKSSSSV